MSDKIIVTYPNGCENTKEAFSNGWNQSVVTAPEGKEITASDGYHTFEELYDHRIELFIALCRVCNYRLEKDHFIEQFQVWRSKKHHDGSSYDGWFIMGINTDEGDQITYHLPMSRWEDTEFAETLDNAPEWDGHTPADVIQRLKGL